MAVLFEQCGSEEGNFSPLKNFAWNINLLFLYHFLITELLTEILFKNKLKILIYTRHHYFNPGDTGQKQTLYCLVINLILDLLLAVERSVIINWFKYD